MSRIEVIKQKGAIEALRNEFADQIKAASALLIEAGQAKNDGQFDRLTGMAQAALEDAKAIRKEIRALE